MRTLLSIVFILLLAGFIPLSCCKNEGNSFYNMDINKINSIHYLSYLNLYDSIATQTDFDTIKNTDSLFLLVNMDLKEIASLKPSFSFTNTAYACKQGTTSYSLKYKIDSIVLSSNTIYNGVAAGRNLFYTIVENAQNYVQEINNSPAFNNANLLFKIKQKPTDNHTHQLTLKIYKDNDSITEKSIKTFTWQ